MPCQGKELAHPIVFKLIELMDGLQLQGIDAQRAQVVQLLQYARECACGMIGSAVRVGRLLHMLGASWQNQVLSIRCAGMTAAHSVQRT